MEYTLQMMSISTPTLSINRNTLITWDQAGLPTDTIRSSNDQVYDQGIVWPILKMFKFPDRSDSTTNTQIWKPDNTPDYFYDNRQPEMTIDDNI